MPCHCGLSARNRSNASMRERDALGIVQPVHADDRERPPGSSPRDDERRTAWRGGPSAWNSCVSMPTGNVRDRDDLRLPTLKRALVEAGRPALARRNSAHNSRHRPRSEIRQGRNGKAPGSVGHGCGNAVRISGGGMGIWRKKPIGLSWPRSRSALASGRGDNRAPRSMSSGSIFARGRRRNVRSPADNRSDRAGRIPPDRPGNAGSATARDWRSRCNIPGNRPRRDRSRVA